MKKTYISKGIRAHAYIMIAYLIALFKAIVKKFDDVDEMKEYIPQPKNFPTDDRSFKQKRWIAVADLFQSKEQLQEYLGIFQEFVKLYADNTKETVIPSNTAFEKYNTLNLLINIYDAIKREKLAVEKIKQGETNDYLRRRINAGKIFTSLASMILVLQKKKEDQVNEINEKYFNLNYVYALSVEWQARIVSELSRRYKIASVGDLVVVDEFEDFKSLHIPKEALSNIIIDLKARVKKQEDSQNDRYSQFKEFLEKLQAGLNSINLEQNEYCFVAVISNPQDYNTFEFIERFIKRKIKGSPLDDAIKAEFNQIAEVLKNQLPSVVPEISSNIEEIGLFYYPGNKSKLKDDIIAYFPEHRVYIEPFLGSGAIFRKKPGSEIAILNDLNDRVYTMWKGIFSGVVNKDKIVKWYHWLKDNYEDLYFKKAKKGEGKAGLRHQVAIELLEKFSDPNLAFLLSLSDPVAVYGVKYVAHHLPSLSHILSLFDEIQQRLREYKEIYLYNTDAIELLDKLRAEYDNEDTVIYIDPPYYKEESKIPYGGTEKGFDTHKLYDVLKKYKNAWIFVSNSIHAIEVFSDYHVLQEFEFKRNDVYTNKKWIRKEVLLANKKPPYNTRYDREED